MIAERPLSAGCNGYFLKFDKGSLHQSLFVTTSDEDIVAAYAFIRTDDEPRFEPMTRAVFDSVELHSGGPPSLPGARPLTDSAPAPRQTVHQKGKARTSSGPAASYPWLR